MRSLLLLFALGLSTAQLLLVNCYAIESDPKVTIEYYSVYGHSVEELNQSLRTAGPIDAKGIRRFAVTDWHIFWNWPTDSATSQIEKIESDYRARLILPEWKDKSTAPKSVQEKWNQMYQLLLKHEYQHLDHARQHYQSIRDVVRKQAQILGARLTSEKAHKIAFNELEKIRALDKAYDSETEHGRKEGVTFIAE